MRKLKYLVASTADGFIAREDGSFDCFPAEGDHVDDYLESLKSYGAVLMGRKTYEVGLKMGVTDPYPFLKSYVFSRTMKTSPNERVAIVSENVAEMVRKLKHEAGKDIYLCGGAELAAELFKEGLVDEVILKLNPLQLGSGIPLLNDIGRHINLELIDTKVYRSGVVLLSYRVMDIAKTS
ncbi:MAG TPA: dihydrofolate reductase family protein [Pyrinomonadaceae bacterium]|nr:dihydrofolate reductase family protein [Pyrinomonadaceae bacterium]